LRRGIFANKHTQARFTITIELIHYVANDNTRIVNDSLVLLLN
jgi:hypothetical protein